MEKCCNEEYYKDCAVDFEKNINIRIENGEKLTQQDIHCEIISYLKFMSESFSKNIWKIILSSPAGFVKEMDHSFKEKYSIWSFTAKIKDIEQIKWLLKCFERDYNEPIWVIKFIINFNLNIPLMQFRRLIPKDMKNRMVNLRKADMSKNKYLLLIEWLKLLDNNENEFENSINWQLIWIQKVFPKWIYIPQVWSCIPPELKEKYNNWYCLKMKSNIATEILIKFRHSTNATLKTYNTLDWQYRWLRDNWFHWIHIWNFLSVVPPEIKKIMIEWKLQKITYQQAEKRYEN